MVMLTIKEAAERLKVDPGLVYRLVGRGEITHARVGFGRGLIRIEEESLADYLARRSRGLATSRTMEKRRAARKPPVLNHFTVGSR